MMQRGLSTLMLIAAAWIAPAAGAGVPAFLSLDPYSLGQGLSQISVTALAEDDQGFLWIGTQDGLNRFDGHRFVVQRAGTEPGEGLASGSIDALAIDRDARLWIGTNESGLEVIDLRGGGRRHVAQGLSHPNVRALLIDPAGGAWLGTHAGIDHVSTDLSQVRRLARAASVVGLAASGDAAFALDSDCALSLLASERTRALPVTLPADARCVALQAGPESLWVATAAHGAYRVDHDGALLEHLPPAHLRADLADPSAVAMSAMLLDGEVLLFGFEDGAIIGGHRDGSGLQRIRFDRALGSAVTRLFRHRSGVLWIGTYTSGLYRARALSSAVRRDLIDDSDIAAWPSRSARAIWTDGERLMVGTDAGLVQRFTPGGAWQAVDGLGGTSIRSIRARDDGGWWIGSHRGLWLLPPDGPARPVEGLPEPRVTDMLADGDGLWVATRGGLARFVDDRLDSRPAAAELDGVFLTSLMRDSAERLWIGSNDRGVFVQDAAGRIEQLDTASGRLRHDSIWSLHEGPRAFWIGSFAGGLQRIDRASGELSVLTERDGLSNNVIYRIVPDRFGRLWLSTNNGLSVVDPSTRVVQNLLPSDGLRSHEYNSGASFAGDDGLLYFGGVEGVDVIDPGELDAVSPPARPVLTTLRVLGRRGAQAIPAAPVDIVYRDRVTLEHVDRIFSLEMVALDFNAPDAAQLRYRIRGVYSDWVLPHGPHAELLLSYLPAGRYLLEVEAAGRDGRFGESRELLIVVEPAPWEHPLAYALYLLLAVLLALWMVSRIGARDRAKRAQIELLNRTVTQRTAELARTNQLLLDSNAQLLHANRTDPLTQVSNRRDLHEWLQRECSQLLEDATRRGVPRRSLLFFMVDIDDFKRINDGFGHQVGDQVLVVFAERLRTLCRDRDILVRWGGEEFMLLLRDTPVADAAAVAERVRRAIADEPIDVAGHSLSVTCSIGFAPWPLSQEWPSLGDWEQSVKLADGALYAAKSSGKNAWVGLAAGDHVDRSSLQQLLAGTAPDELRPGSIDLLHSTRERPSFPMQ